MAFKDLRDFIARLESKGDLKRIRAPVSPDLEVTEITERVIASGGPALLFEQVVGHSSPVFVNAFGAERRVCLALEVSGLDELSKRVEALLNLGPPVGAWEKFKLLFRLKEWAGYLPTRVKGGPCKEVIRGDDFSLLDLPALKCWPEDGGRFITLPLVFSRDPRTGRQNCGIYRMQIYDPRTTGMHWHAHKQSAIRYQGMGREERLEVAAVIGADPVVTFCAALPLPDYFDEMLVAGFLRQEGVRMVKAETVDVEVPANAEIVLEGHVTVGELRPEGPFGDHTGFYTPADHYPVFHLSCVTHREDPIYHTMVVGRPPKEDNFLGMAIERLLLPLMRVQFPEIRDVHFPFEGVFHNLIVVSIEKRYPGHARKVMHGLWGLGQAMFSKVIVVVDEEEDVRDLKRIAWKVLNNIDPQRDMEFVLGPVETLDHASRLPKFGSKVGIDATRKWPEEGFSRPWPGEARMAENIIDTVTRRWKEYGF